MTTTQDNFALPSFKLLRNLIITLVLCIAAPPKLSAQTNDWPQNFAMIPILLNNPAAMDFVSNLMSGPQPALSIPEFSPTNTNPEGTFWMLTKGAPMPYNPFPDLTVYQVGTNSQFIVDDRSVDYAGLNAQLQAGSEANPITTPPITISSIDTNGLWIQVPTNSLASPGNFSVNLMNTLEDQSYDVLTTPYLPGLWATELMVTGAVGNVTPATVPMNGRTNLFVWARTSAAYSFYLVTEPLSQDVWWGDDVTFIVATGGNANLSYQWTFDGNPIQDATNSTYTIYGVQDGDAGDYACIISDGVNSIVTGAAQLKTDGFSGDPLIIPVVSSRQSYHFKSGITYYIAGRIQLFGETTIDAGAVLKLDYNPQRVTNSSLIVMGGLTCNTEAYNPAILTTVDDDASGEPFSFSTGSAQTVSAGVPFLDLTSSTSNSISNLRFLFADWGVTTPVNTPQLDIWDCQFVNCNYGVVNLAEGSSVDRLHNVLFAGCEAAIGASSNSISIQGEHVTADVADFCLADTMPSAIALTNSILWGNSLSAASVSTMNVAMNPDGTNFVTAGQGNYYLSSGSPLHREGSANISPRLQAEFQHKTTYAPLSVPFSAQITGQMTLAPQALRYTNGAPDYGYYYDALDYTAAALFVSGGSLTILPGTAIAFRNDYTTNGPSGPSWSTYGCYVYQGGSVISHGTPTKPNVFTSLDRVQETPNFAFAEYVITNSEFSSSLLPGICSFVTDLEPVDIGSPSLDFRFSQFYLPTEGIHICSGLSFDGAWGFSSSAGVNLNLQDCDVHNGQIDLGEPFGAPGQVYGSGIVNWKNTLFENVSVNLDPTSGVDMSFQAENNLFRGGLWLHIEPIIPASAGYWLFENNLFDQVNFVQDTNQPLDYAYNAYWPLSAHAVSWDLLIDPWFINNASSLQMTTTADGFSDGQWEQYLSAAPPYQSGPYGNYYLPNTTPLYGAGSTNAASLGLYHYTTETNQFKEGDEAANHNINIGLHYVAADASGVPVDSDNDGIPDYVENWHGDGNYAAHADSETDWSTNYTVSGVWDPTNSIYDDTDLSGDGLVGRIKKAFGMGPFDASNPFTLIPSTSGGDPQVAKFHLPLNYNILTNITDVRLSLDGSPATVQGIEQDNTDGSTIAGWNTIFDPPGPHLLQPRIYLKTTDWSTAANGNAVTMAVGPLLPIETANVAQFYPAYSFYQSSGATLYAQTYPSATYTITVTDPSGNPLTNFTGNADDNGTINVFWPNLIESDGETQYNGNSFNTTFSVTPPGEAAASVYQITNNLVELGFDDAKHGDFTTAYSWDVTQLCGKGNDLDVMIQNSVTDPLLLRIPTTGDEFVNPDVAYDSAAFNLDSASALNNYGNPGWICGLTVGDPLGNDLHHTVPELLTNLSNATGDDGFYTRNFYWYGHGAPAWIGNKLLGDAAVDISVDQVCSALGNSLISYDKPWTLKHPYRFVFLDGCSTQSEPLWAQAFGILQPSDTFVEANPQLAQAMLGFNKEVAVIGPGQTQYYTYTLNVFFLLWQGGTTLQTSVTDCATKKNLARTFSQLGIAYPYDPVYLFPIGEPVGNGSGFGGSPDEGKANVIQGYKFITRTSISPGQ